MRALKALVIVMGVLIVAGTAVVGYTIVKRSTVPATPMPAAGSAVAKTPFGPVELALPPGARILRTDAEGGRLLVELELPGGGRRVLVVDLASGALVGTIDLKPQP